MIRWLACFAVMGALSVYACSNDETRPPAETDPSSAQPYQPISGSSGVATEDSSTTDTDSGIDANGTCTDITLTGFVVDEEAVAQNVPAGTGGTIQDGTYDLQQVQKYEGATGSIAGPTGITYQSTIRITNGTTFERDVILASNQTGGTEERSVGVMVMTSPTLTITFNCPIQTQEQYTYSVTGSGLVLTNTTTGESYTYALKT